jgi:prepilin-type N-terminal cleavage/methylation domain-containing protein
MRNRNNMNTCAGFTLVEILTVISIISLTAAVLYPVFAMSRGKAREISCLSNLRQIGLSVMMYSQDYDDCYPYAIDPTDKLRPQIWSRYPEFQADIPQMPYLHEVVLPYLKSKQVFRCPEDTGYEADDNYGLPIDASPSSFLKFGTSYSYRTEIAAQRASEATFRRPSELNVLMDATGRWHGGEPESEMRYNVWHADGHTKSLSRAQLLRLWLLPIQ